MLAHTREKPDSAQTRLARLRFGNRSLELLPALDDLRERITLALSAARPPQRAPQPADTEELLTCMERWLTARG